MVEPPHPVLAQGRVRHVGDPVAVVIAETRNRAKDAAELISVNYKELPAVIEATDALKPGKPQIWDAATSNLCYDWHIGEKDAVDPALKKANACGRASTSWTTGWCRMRWSRAPRSATTTAGPASTRSTPRARTRM